MKTLQSFLSLSKNASLWYNWLIYFSIKKKLITRLDNQYFHMRTVGDAKVECCIHLRSVFYSEKSSDLFFFIITDQ